MGGNNSVIPERTLRKEAIQQYLDGGLTLEAIVYQACTGCIMPCAPCGTAGAVSLPAMPDRWYWLLLIGLHPHTRQRRMDAWAWIAQPRPQPGG